MKKKILLIILISTIITFFIYYFNKDEKIYFLALGDGIAEGMTAFNVEGYSYNDYIRDALQEDHQLKRYIKGFISQDQRVDELNNLIEENIEINIKKENLPIQQAISKADIITLSIGSDELFSKKQVTSKEEKKYMTDMAYLLANIRHLSDAPLYLVGLYTKENIKEATLSNINNGLSKLAEYYNVTFINIQSFINKSEYWSTTTSYYFNYKGHDAISKKILEDYLPNIK